MGDELEALGGALRGGEQAPFQVGEDLRAWDAVGVEQFSLEEMKAIVETAARAERKVAAHAHGNAGIKSAVRAGVVPKVAEELAARTMLGTAAILVREGIKPGELCAAVASPGGTTEAGLKAMQPGLRSLAEKATIAAIRRAKELANGR